MVGPVLDPQTGLVYLRARYYDPSTAQFLTRDPLGQLTRQPYSYANDNPINNTDPTGLDCGITDPGGCINDAVGGAASVASNAGTFVANNWRPIASAAADVGTAAACTFSAGTACGFAIGVNLAAQSALVATGAGSTGHKIALIGVNVLLAGGASAGAGAAEYMDEIAASSGVATSSWVRPFVSATGAAPYLGLTAAQLAAYLWKSC